MAIPGTIMLVLVAIIGLVLLNLNSMGTIHILILPQFILRIIIINIMVILSVAY